jgi:hypothetical protein
MVMGRLGIKPYLYQMVILLMHKAKSLNIPLQS